MHNTEIAPEHISVEGVSVTCHKNSRDRIQKINLEFALGI